MAKKSNPDRGLYERPPGSGIWWVQYNDHEGRKCRKKAGSKSAARLIYQKRMAEKLDRMNFPERNRPAPQKALTLAELVEKYAAETRANKKSWQWDERIAGHWVAAFGPTRAIESIQPGDIEQQKAVWLADLAPATVNRRLAYLKTLFGKAVRDGLTERNPLSQRRVKMMREPQAPDRFLSPQEEQALQAHLSRQDWLALVVALQTGLRISEQLERRREDVDLKKGLLFIPEAKGGGRQEVRLNQVARAALKEVLGSHSHPWVFPSPDGKEPLSRSSLSQRFRRACQAAGIKGVSWHTTRHTFISRLCMLGIPLPTVQKLARHKSIQMTLRYSHLCPSHLQESLESLAAAYPGA